MLTTDSSLLIPNPTLLFLIYGRRAGLRFTLRLNPLLLIYSLRIRFNGIFIFYRCLSFRGRIIGHPDRCAYIINTRYSDTTNKQNPEAD